MPKKKTPRPPRPLTRRQLSRWEQQRKRQRLIVSIGILVMVTALAFVGAGWYIGSFQPMRETVLVVNDREFSMAYYVEMLEIQASQGPTEAQLRSMADAAETSIQRSELIRQEARELGVTVSDEDARRELENNELPVTEVYLDLARSKLVLDRLMEGHFDREVPSQALQRQITAMLLESEPRAQEVRQRIVSGESFTGLAAELSLEDYTRSNEGDFGWVPRSVLEELLGTAIAQEFFELPVGPMQLVHDEEASKQVGYWLVRVLDRNEEEGEVHLQVMLLGSEAEALEIRDRLEAGEDFATLAVEHSRVSGVEENKGEYLVGPGMMQAPVEEYAFSPETVVGQVSAPIRDDTVSTTGGYWLVRVAAEEEDRQIDREYRDFLKNLAFNEWVSSILEDPENQVTSHLDEAKKDWAVARVMRG